MPVYHHRDVDDQRIAAAQSGDAPVGSIVDENGQAGDVEVAAGVDHAADDGPFDIRKPMSADRLIDDAEAFIEDFPARRHSRGNLGKVERFVPDRAPGSRAA